MQSLVNCIRARVGSEPRVAERVSGEGRSRGMACGAGAAPGAALGRRRVGWRRRGRNQDVLSCYLANTSSSLVSVAGFCC